MLRHLQLIKPLWLLAGPEPPFWKLKHEHDIRFLMTVDFEVLSSMIADYDNSIDIEGRVKDFENVIIVYGIIKVQILFTFVSLVITLPSPPSFGEAPVGYSNTKMHKLKTSKRAVNDGKRESLFPSHHSRALVFFPLPSLHKTQRGLCGGESSWNGRVVCYSNVKICEPIG